MTSKLTRERLEKIKSWRETYGAGSNVMLPAEEAEELARIALAAMDSEPVAEVLSNRPGNDTSTIDRALPVGTQLYLHAQLAPVVPELRVDWQENEFSAGWNACRAAMLQAVPLINEGDIALHNYRTTLEGIGHIRRTLEETFGGLHGTHVEPDVLMECKAICDAIYAAYRGSAPVVPDDVSIFEAAIEECKKCDSIDEHAWNHGVLAVIAKYESCRAAMLAAAPQSPGSEPATVPGKWIPVSEQMPEVGDIVLTAMGGAVNVGEMECSAANCCFFTSVISGRELPATHWMPLPAGPQEPKP